LSTPIDQFRKIPRLFKAVNSFNSRIWWAQNAPDAALGIHLCLKCLYL